MSEIPKTWNRVSPAEPGTHRVAYQLDGMGKDVSCHCNAWWDGEGWLFFDEPEESMSEYPQVVAWCVR